MPVDKYCQGGAAKPIELSHSRWYDIFFTRSYEGGGGTALPRVTTDATRPDQRPEDRRSTTVRTRHAVCVLRRCSSEAGSHFNTFALPTPAPLIS